MRLPKLSLKMRILVALAAIALVRAGFYYVPRRLAARPVFDPAAYAEALETLKEVVGGEAVANGCFAIPEVSQPGVYRGLACAGRPMRRTVSTESPQAATCYALVIDDAGPILIVLEARLDATAGTDTVSGRAAAVDIEAAQRIWRTLSHLSTMTTQLWSETGHVPKDRMVRRVAASMTDLGWRRPSKSGDPSSVTMKFLQDACAAAYFRRLVASGNLRWTDSQGDVSVAAARGLLAAVRADDSRTGLAPAALEYAGAFGGKASAPYLKSARQHLRPLGKRTGKTKSRILDAILQFIFARQSQPQPALAGMRDSIAAAEGFLRLRSEPPSEALFGRLSAAILAKAESSLPGFYAARLMVEKWPESGRRFLEENVAAIPPGVRGLLLVRYRDVFGDDAGFARAVPRSRYESDKYALYHNNRLTGDADALDMLVVASMNWRGPYEPLRSMMRSLARDAAVSRRISEYYRLHHSPAAREAVVLDFLARVGGEENMALLAKVAVAVPPRDENDVEIDVEAVMIEGAYALGIIERSGDPFAAKTLEYCLKNAPAYERKVEAANALARLGDLEAAGLMKLVVWAPPDEETPPPDIRFYAPHLLRLKAAADPVPYLLGLLGSRRVAQIGDPGDFDSFREMEARDEFGMVEEHIMAAFIERYPAESLRALLADRANAPLSRYIIEALLVALDHESATPQPAPAK